MRKTSYLPIKLNLINNKSINTQHLSSACRADALFCFPINASPLQQIITIQPIEAVRLMQVNGACVAATLNNTHT